MPELKEAFGVYYADLAKTGFITEPLDSSYYYHRFNGLGDLKRFVSFASKNGEYRARSNEMESDETFIQLIMCAFHLKPDGTFFIFQRGKQRSDGGAYDEARLAGTWSVCVGGHMERTDLSLAFSFKRELAEEAYGNLGDKTISFMNPDGADIKKTREYFKLQPRGIIKDTRMPIDKYHVGIVTRLLPYNQELSLKIIENGENVSSQYVSIGEYEDLIRSGQIEVESWSDAVVNEEIAPLITQELKVDPVLSIVKV